MSRNVLSLPILITFFLLTVVFYPSPSSATMCNQHDKAALLAFKNSFRYTTLGKWWSDSTDCCSSWKFVGCDNATGRVTSLELINENITLSGQIIVLKGSIPASIGDLSALESLQFTNILSLSGTIPPQISKLTKLKSLAIDSTKISGSIPPSLGNLVSLTDISFTRTRLTGSIPSSLFSKLPKGSIANLFIILTRLTGAVPSSFDNVQFSLLNLAGNRLTGDPSVLFGESKSVTEIILSQNNFSFDFSKVVLPLNASFIALDHNRIYGTIPDQVTRLPYLGYFDVSYNDLCGKIPTGGYFGEAHSYFQHNKCLCAQSPPACK